MAQRGEMKMRRVKGWRIKELREEWGMSRKELASQAGIIASHIGKIERGETEWIKTRTLSGFAAALGVSRKEIAHTSPLTDVERWADANDVSISWTYELAEDGRIEGAYRDEEGWWHIEPNAGILGPTDKSRARWRERWGRYQRRRLQRHDGMGAMEGNRGSAEGS